ncbi:phosphomannomutase/phosphoglucomutase [Candidatus Hydrogenosomobacter endosymbioticus]|uniref:phosphomannomutase/phosphoglucomutase n=1 Tax=Candidatus Hydrogenosomobacter endosymbioticus TaxID=2558174 RepID=UPI001F210789|nr:phosphomannomutase/phosphoglucomutase [Candidatus Hydrogenosomobacter endosymbioticus]
MNRSIFREYDVRGTFMKTLFPKDAFDIGVSFGALCAVKAGDGCGELLVCVARDGRLSSPELFENLVRGLVSAGVTVIDCGVGPTPYLYWTDFYLRPAGAVMVTGSHNPSSDNGFKLTVKQAPLFGDALRAMCDMSTQFIGGDRQKRGKVVECDYRNLYVNALINSVEHGLHGFCENIVWDPGFGASAEILHMIAARLPGNHFIINGKIDGSFPGATPDPTDPGRVERLKEFIATHECAAGFAFDGDADRLVVADEFGEILAGDELFAHFISHKLATDGGKCNCIVDVKFSDILKFDLEHKGAKIRQAKTGHVHIKSSMRELERSIAGEVSGHYFFSDDWNGCDDSIYAALRFMNVMKANNRRLSEWSSHLPPRYASRELRLNCPEDVKWKVAENIKCRLENVSISEIDGIRITCDDGWWLVRPSQTEEKVVVRWESPTVDGYSKMERRIMMLLRSSGVAV